MVSNQKSQTFALSVINKLKAPFLRCFFYGLERIILTPYVNFCYLGHCSDTGTSHAQRSFDVKDQPNDQVNQPHLLVAIVHGNKVRCAPALRRNIATIIVSKEENSPHVTLFTGQE